MGTTPPKGHEEPAAQSKPPEEEDYGPQGQIDGHIDRWSKDTRAPTGLGCLTMVIIILAIVAAAMFPDLSGRGSEQSSGVNTVTGAAYRSSSQPEEVTPAGWAVGAGSEQQLAHDGAASAVSPGQGPGGVGNSLNPQAAERPQTPTHTDTPQPAPEAAPAPPPPCDTQDPHSPCYEPPCDTSDPHGPCYEPPPYQHNDECDPNSYYYDPDAICL